MKSDRDIKPENMMESGPDAPNTADDDVLDVHGAAALLRVGRNAMYAMCAQNKIPHRRIGNRPEGGGRGTIRFSRAALLKWLEGDR